MYKNTKRIDTMFVQKNVRRNYQWQKIIMLQKTVQTKIHMDPIRMRMLKMLPARISQIKIQAIKMHPVKIRLTGMQRMHMNQTVMHMTAQSPAITKVISIKSAKQLRMEKQRFGFRCFSVFGVAIWFLKKIVVQAHYLTKGNRKT